MAIYRGKMEILLWAMFVRFSRRVSQLLEIQTLRLLEWNLFLSMYPGSFSGAQLHTNNTWFSLRKATGRARSTGHSQGLGCLGVRVSTWLMANAKQYLICRICAIYFWPTKILPVPTSNNKLDPWWVVALQEVNVSFCAMKKRPVFIRVVDELIQIS